jgi:nitrogen fixation/metabolism regulation signal transduction histidine kinase
MVFFKKEFDPVVTMTTAHDRLRDGDLTVRVDESMVGDEFLSLYSRLNVFSVNQQMATIQLTNDVAAQTNRLSAVIDNIVDHIITISELGFIESFNPTTRRIFEYSN